LFKKADNFEKINNKKNRRLYENRKLKKEKNVYIRVVKTNGNINQQYIFLSIYFWSRIMDRDNSFHFLIH